jgi:hypothetical protein
MMVPILGRDEFRQNSYPVASWLDPLLHRKYARSSARYCTASATSDDPISSPSRQISNRPRHLDDAVVRTGREPEALDGGEEETAGGWVESAERRMW